MYSLNQVNKLVSCGRDPARSLPFWRGSLFIPLILVSLSICAAKRQHDTEPWSVGGSLNTADGFHALFNVTGTANSAFGWNSMVFDTAATSILALVLERWSSTTRMLTRPLALLP